jgi:hypothetical protein
MAAALRATSGIDLPDNEEATVVTRPATMQAPKPVASGTESGSGLESLDGSSLSTIERRLAHYIGPMAGYHIRRALQNAHSPEDFCASLSELLPTETQRSAFVKEALNLVTTQSGLRLLAAAGEIPPASTAGITAEDIVHVTGALAQIMGPIAPRLVKRAQTKSATRLDLETACAELIENDAERGRFVRILLGSR